MFLPTQNPRKIQSNTAIQNTEIFAEIMYNSNSNSYTSNSNSKVDNIRITHNSNRLNEIVEVSSNPSINAKCV